MAFSPAKSYNQIIPFIHDHLRGLPDPSETRCTKGSRIGLKFSAVCVGVGGAIPNIAVALKFGGKNRALGIVVAISNFTTRTGLSSWSYFHIIDGEIGPLGKVNKNLSSKKLSVCKRAIIKVCVFAVAFFAQMPRAYLSYVYNGNNLVYPILTLVALSAVPAYSLDLSSRAALSVKNLSSFERLLNQIKGDVKRNIQNCRLKILDLSPRDRKALVANLVVLLNNSSAEAAVTTVFCRVCKEGNLPPQQLTRSQKVRKVASTVLNRLTGLVTTVAQAGFLSWVGIKAAESAYDDDPSFKYIVGVVVLLSNLYLTTKVMFQHSDKLFKQVFFKPVQLLTGETVSSVIIPKTSVAAGLMTSTVAAFSTGTMMQAVDDYVKGDLHPILKVLVPVSMFLLGREALSDSVDGIFTVFIRCYSKSEDQINVLQLDHALKEFTLIIEKLDFRDFAQLLISLPDEVFAEFIKNRVSKEQLKTYTDVIIDEGKKAIPL